MRVGVLTPHNSRVGLCALHFFQRQSPRSVVRWASDWEVEVRIQLWIGRLSEAAGTASSSENYMYPVLNVSFLGFLQNGVICTQMDIGQHDILMIIFKCT